MRQQTLNIEGVFCLSCLSIINAIFGYRVTVPFFPIEAYLAHTLMSLLLINQLLLLLELLLITTQSILIGVQFYVLL